MPIPAVVAPNAPPIDAPVTSPDDALALVAPAPAPAVVGANLSPRDQLIAGGDAPLLGPPNPNAGLPPSSATNVANLPVASPPAPVLPTGELPDIAKANADEQTAARGEAGAKATNADELAAEQTKAAEEHARQAEELRVQGEQDQLANDEAHRQTEDALVAARDKAIPSFWEGREGKRAETALWVALGGAGAALLGQSTNGAAEIVQHNVDAYYRREKDKIDNLYKYAEKRGEMEQGQRLQQAQRLAALQVQYGETNMAIAGRIEAMKTAGQGRIDAASADRLAADLVSKGQKQILDARETFAKINKLNADAARAQAKARAAGAGGGGARGDALAAFAEAAGALKPGEAIPPSLVKLGVAAHLKPNQIASEADKYRGSGVKAGAAAAKENAATLKLTEADEARAIRDPVTGEVKGLAASTREVPALRKLLINYDQAIKSLAEIKASGNYIAKGSLWDNAVLAIAATTTAGQTDANVRHEAGTMLNRAGLLEDAALARKIKDLETRRDQFYRTLSPAKAAAGAGAKPENLPAGAVMGKNKDGVRGYKVPGQPFVAL